MMEAVRFPPVEDNRMSIWEISSLPCGKARSPKLRRTGQASPVFRQIGESGSSERRCYKGKLGYRKQWTARTYIKRAEMALNDR